MPNQTKISRKIGLGVSLILLVSLLLGLGFMYKQEREKLDNLVHDKTERLILALQASHTQAMLYRGDTDDNNPVLNAFNGTIASLSSTQKAMKIWLIMGPKVVEFQRKVGSDEIEPPIDEVDHEAITSQLSVGRYISDTIYRFTLPIILGQGAADNPACFTCHAKDMGMQAGEPIGGFSVAYDASDDINHFKSLFIRSVITILLIVMGITLLIVFYINRLVSHPISSIASTMSSISAVDKTVVIPDPVLAESAEIAEILTALNIFHGFTQSNLDEMKQALDKHNIVSVTNLKGDITYANDLFSKISGYSQDELIGQNHRILKSGEHSEEVYKNLWRTIAKGKIWQGELKNRCKDGSFYWVNATIIPFLDEPGKPYEYISIRTDITDAKEKEHSLIKANKEAEAANVAKSQFLSTMSHEIRTPMNGVIGMAQLLEDTPLNDEQQDYLATITRSGNNLLSIINDILDFSKLDADMTELESIPFDLERVCQESMELVAGNAKDKKLEFIFDYHPDCPRRFIGDPSRIRQVLINLLGNAIKFTHKGFIRCGVQCKEDEKGHSQLHLEIQDTGIGLKPEAVKNLFEEFTQADTTTTRKYGGTGLGLAISKKLVGLMGGELKVESTFGEGTIFHVKGRFPIAEDVPPLNSESLESVRVLFVDDHEENRRIFKRMLEHMGIDVVTESNPQKTLSLMDDAQDASNPFRIVILDHNMPIVSGLDIGLSIRKEVRFDEIKLLIFSSVGQKGDSAIFSKAGFNAYLNKLSRYETLKSILSTMLSHQAGKPMITQHSINEAKTTKQGAVNFNASILLAEDVLPNQIIAQMFLSAMGASVTIANDGEEAVAAFKEKDFDLIFMDCHMPNMDGYEATQAIRILEEENKKAPIPIVALTANASNDDRALCINAGMNDVVTKPFKRDDLSQSLKKWLADES